MMKMKMKILHKNIFLIIIVCTTYTFCHSITPKIPFSIPQDFIHNLKTPFAPLSQEEKTLPFAKELLIAQKFTEELDLYQSIQSFKRAKFLLQDHQSQRARQIDYNILLAYYFANHYEDVIHTFEYSSLTSLNKDLCLYQDLLCIVFDSYQKEKKPEKAEEMLKMLYAVNPHKAETLRLSQACTSANFLQIQSLCHENRIYHLLDHIAANTKNPLSEEQSQDMTLFLQNKDTQNTSNLTASLNQEHTHTLENLLALQSIHKESLALLKTYKKNTKSPAKAACLNALLPGLGYLYLGQKQSAFTAFCLNSLFIASALHFYQIGNIPAALITLSFESGWYTGGILGAKENAALYNERLYEGLYTGHMNKNKLFATTMLCYGF